MFDEFDPTATDFPLRHTIFSVVHRRAQKLFVLGNDRFDIAYSDESGINFERDNFSNCAISSAEDYWNKGTDGHHR